MAQVLDALVPVGPLAAGAVVVLPHGLVDHAGGLVPTFINPLALTPIGVTAATATSVTFQNLGNQTESAVFLVRRDHSTQVPAVGAVAAWWAGYVGLKSFLLDTPQYDDLRVPLIGTTAYGLQPAVRSKIVDDGTFAGASFAVQYDGVTAAGTMADFGNLAIDFSIVAWFSSSYVGVPVRRLIFKNAAIDLRLSGGNLTLQLQGHTAVVIPGFSSGATTYLVINVTAGVSDVTIDAWIDNVNVLSITQAGALAADNANPWYVATNTAQQLACKIGELRFYQTTLTPAQIDELWAAGGGTQAEPAGAPAILAGYHFNEGVGLLADNYQGNPALDMTLTDPAWVTGFIGIPGSRGVFAYLFPAGEDTELLFTAQMPHGYKEGTDYDVHAHWFRQDGGAAGDVMLRVEYLRHNHSGAVYGKSTVVDKVVAAPAAGVAALTSIATLSGTLEIGETARISHLIIARIARRGSDALDTFTGAIFITEVDFHYQLDTLGSRAETVK